VLQNSLYIQVESAALLLFPYTSDHDSYPAYHSSWRRGGMIYIAKTSNSVSCHEHLPMLICVVGLVLSSTSCRPGWRRSPAWGTQSIQASTRTPRLRGLASPAVQRLSINNSAIRSSTLCHTSIGCSSPGSSRSRFTVSDWGRTMPLQCSQRMSEVERGTARKLLFDLKRYWHHNLTSEFLQVHDPTAQPFPYADLGLYDFTAIVSEDRADHMMSTKAHKTREPVNTPSLIHSRFPTTVSPSPRRYHTNHPRH
jgi:hypothetical protein